MRPAAPLLRGQGREVYREVAYDAPTILARRLRIEEADLRAGLDQLVEARQAEKRTLPGYKGECCVWSEDAH